MVKTARITSNKPRKGTRYRDAFAFDYLPLFHLPHRHYRYIVRYPLRPPRNALAILPSTLAIDVNTPISTRFLSGTRDLLLL